jgi:hypothetical protein
MVNQSIWGDWDAAFPRADYVPVTAPICATANMMRIAQLLAGLAPLVGRSGDIPAYEALLNSSVAPFNAHYALNLANGTYVDGIEQTPARAYRGCGPQAGAPLSLVPRLFSCTCSHGTRHWLRASRGRRGCAELADSRCVGKLGRMDGACIGIPSLFVASISDVETTHGVHLSTGATGTRYLFEQLSTMGRTDLAAAVAAQATFPSHGYWFV